MRCTALDHVIVAYDERAVVARENRAALSVGHNGVDRSRAVAELIAAAVLGDDNVLRVIQRKLCTLERISVFVYLIHIEIILDIWDIQLRGKDALKIRAVYPVGIARIGVLDAAGRIIIGYRICRILGVLAVNVLLPEIVVPDIAGAVFYLSHIRAVGRECELRIAARVLTDGAQRGAYIALIAVAADDVPAAERGAGDNAPLIAQRGRGLADIRQPAHYDRKGGAAVFKVDGFDKIALPVAQVYLRAGHDGLFRADIAAGLPVLSLVVEHDGVSRLEVVRLDDKIVLLLRTVALVCVVFLEYQIFYAALVKFVKAYDGLVAVGKDEVAVCVGRAACEKAAVFKACIDDIAAVFLLRGIELKADARERVSGLVDLDALGLGDIGEVELHGEVRVRSAALEIKELERVVRIIAQRVVAPIVLSRIVSLHRIAESLLIYAVYVYLTCLKVYLRRCKVVYAAEVRDEHAVYEDPDVVITGKLIGHGLGVCVVLRPAAVALDEARRHAHAEIVVDAVVEGCEVLILRDPPVGLAEHVVRIRVVEREELTQYLACPSAGALNAPSVIEREAVRRFVKGGIVCRFVAALRYLILRGIIIIVSGAVYLKKPLDAHERLLGVVYILAVEEIVKRLLAAEYPVLDRVSGGEHRISVLEQRLHYPRTRRIILADIGVYGALIIVFAQEAKLVRFVYSAVLIRGIRGIIVVIIAVIRHPIVEKVERYAGRVDRIRDDMVRKPFSVRRKRRLDQPHTENKSTDETQRSSKGIVRFRQSSHKRPPINTAAATRS